MTDEPIELMCHHPMWFTGFEMESRLLNASLTDYIANIHHVGSTAIPSIQAKPIIDIAIESSAYPPSDSIETTLADIGYEIRGDGGVIGRIWFSKGTPRTFHLHWCPVNSLVVQSQIQFRNALLNDDTLAKEYEQLKLNASSGKNIDSPEYANEKNAFILKVLSL